LLLAGDLSFKTLESGVGRRGLDAVQPGAPGFCARNGKGCAGELFGIEPKGMALRRVLPGWQTTWHGLAAELIAEAALISQGS
jgi:hypothetical protein